MNPAGWNRQAKTHVPGIGTQGVNVWKALARRSPSAGAAEATPERARAKRATKDIRAIGERKRKVLLFLGGLALGLSIPALKEKSKRRVFFC